MVRAMGDEVAATVFSREDRQRYREKVKRCLDVFARMLAESRFDAAPGSIGLEIELNLTDEAGDPAMLNAQVLEAIADADFQTELAQFNVEINIPPRSLAGDVLRRARARRAHEPQPRRGEGPRRRRAHGDGGDPADGRPTATSTPTPSAPTRATQLLNEQIFAARGEDLDIRIDGVERLSTFADTITPEAACTSVQLHLQVDPGAFGVHWNAAQAIAGIQLALGANSPFFFGKELWRETRIALFEQATDTRPEELQGAGRAPARVVRRALDHLDLRPLRGERPLLPRAAAGVRGRRTRWRCSSAATSRGCRSCACTTARSTAGTGPIYDVVRGRPHLRVENRVLPAGPDRRRHPRQRRASTTGWSACWSSEERPMWSQMSFSAAEENFHAGARDGIDARVYWPGVGEVPVAELVLRRLLPMAHEGLERWGVDRADRDRLLGDHRAALPDACATAPSWQAATFHTLYEERKLDRGDALREMTVRYRELMHSNEPVHAWPVD